VNLRAPRKDNPRVSTKTIKGEKLRRQLDFGNEPGPSLVYKFANPNDSSVEIESDADESPAPSPAKK